ALWAARPQPGPGERCRRRPGHGGQPPAARLPPQHALVLPPGRQRPALVSRPGTGPARRPLCRAGAERRPPPAGWPVITMVDRPGPDGRLVRTVLAEGRRGAAPLGGRVSADRRADPAAGGPVAAAAAGTTACPAGAVRPGPALARSVGTVA